MSLLVGIVIAIGGAYSQADGKPFPADGLIPFLKPFYDYSWVVGLAVAFVLYGALTLTVGRKHIQAQTADVEPAPVTGAVPAA